MANLTRAEHRELLRKMREEAERKFQESKLNSTPILAVEVKKELPHVAIRATHFTGAIIYINVSDFSEREDVGMLLNNGKYMFRRAYTGENEYGIPIGEWIEFATKARELENVATKMNKDLKEELDWYLNAPNWLIQVSEKWITVSYGPRTNHDPLYYVPGATKDVERKMWKVPLTEGWKLYDKLEKIEGVVYTEEAQSYIIKQIEDRSKLDEIAKMERGEKYFDYDFGGIAKLRPFQEVGSEFVECANGRAIIADEMGLGKTWQALAYAVKNNFRTVVICPASLKPNWAREIRHLTQQRPYVLQGGEPTTGTLVEFVTEAPQFAIINYDIVGRATRYKTSFVDDKGFKHESEEKTRYQWLELINLSKPDLVIIDEGHYIKNIDSNRSKAVRLIKCPRVLFLTGTPVLNRPGELWPMLTILRPDQFPSNERFLSQYTYDGKTAKNVDELRTLMRPLMIRRLKKDVVKELPPINRINEYHELSEKALRIYRKIELGIYEMLGELHGKYSEGREVGITSILAQIQRLKMVCAIDKVDQTAELASELYESTDESGNRKVLIFTQYKAVAYAIWQRLADQGALSFVSRGRSDFITADQQKRDDLVQQFQNDPSIKFLVVTEKTTKEGHNITTAGHVIFNDLFWTPAGHDQAEGRAYGRLSNLHSINSYYMITEMNGDSIEEWIMDLLSEKQQVINEVVEGVEASRDVSIANALIQKMRDNMWTKRK